jgi:8-oxo-dGTP pyrophosphatase MutT (NUDIX family)
MTGVETDHPYLALMNDADRDLRWPNQRPRDAATMIIIDRSGKKPTVLMGKRHEGHKFMPGKFVFPGGRIEPHDRLMPVAGTLSEFVETRLLQHVQRPTLSRARGLALAAIRETFEETGLMIGSRDYGAPEQTPAGPWQHFMEQAIFPVLEEIHFVGRAITPPRRPKRFDTRFFAVDRTEISHEVGGIIGPEAELVELVWVPIEEAPALDLPIVTEVMLKELQDRISAGFTHQLPVPFYRCVNGRFVRSLL